MGYFMDLVYYISRNYFKL